MKYYAPDATKSKISYFKYKGQSQSNMTLVSFNRASLVEYACQNVKSLSLTAQIL